MQSVVSKSPCQKLQGLYRVRLVIAGVVQGVGFRPFVFSLANELNLNGWIKNSPQGVLIEVEGSKSSIDRFISLLKEKKPAPAIIKSIECSILDAVGYDTFQIGESLEDGPTTTLITPDLATCADCLREMATPAERRYRYPFINCRYCGPRFTIIDALPYDRRNTSMRHFTMCDDCWREYNDPTNRRFHAEAIACPACGPHLELWNAEGAVIAADDSALLESAEIIRRGGIIALKGIGGFQLVVDARNEEALRTLRARKGREEKPFAVMFPSLGHTKAECYIDSLEEQLLRSVQSPIVLLKRKTLAGPDIANAVAPNNPYLGVMLPYSPLHHLLLEELKFPVVATSGNISDEPICTTEHRALTRMRGIADAYLIHNRPIVRHVDDSIARIVGERVQLLRRARGYAPLPISLAFEREVSVLGVGGHLKNTVAVIVGGGIVLSQHIGNLESQESLDTFRKATSDLIELYDTPPDVIACDAHPDYASTKSAYDFGLPVQHVQHHHAHVLSCMADNGLEPPVLGIAWDGTGLGTDGTIWGGEFITIDEEWTWKRVAHLRPFPLPGGDAAVREPRRAALGVLYELLGDKVFMRNDLTFLRSFTSHQISILRQMLKKKLNTPMTSSVGRLFDAVASLLDLHQTVSFEGQAAMSLEFAADTVVCDSSYRFPTTAWGADDQALIIDWRPMIEEIVADLTNDVQRKYIPAKFHNTLAAMALCLARHVGTKRVVLTGGCFQNKLLSERLINCLRNAAFVPYWHHEIPANDGGIALGQIVAVLQKQNAAASNHVRSI